MHVCIVVDVDCLMVDRIVIDFLADHLVYLGSLRPTLYNGNTAAT